MKSKKRAHSKKATVSDTGITVNIGEYLKTLKDHPWRSECPVCKHDCRHTAMVDLVYRYTTCDCSAAPYTHLVETLYHANCYGGIGIK